MPDSVVLTTISDFLRAAVRMASPIFIAAVGLVFTGRSGITNIGAEGTMLMGSLAAVIGAYFLGSPGAGLLVAMLVGLLVGLFFAYLVVSVKADQIVMGMAINLLGLGATTTFFRIVFKISTVPPQVAGFAPWEVPLLSRIPVLGPAFFAQVPVVYVGFILVAVAHFVLFRTTWGLSVRAVGEHPRAADTVGISVLAVRYACCLVDGLMAGLAGGYLSLGLLRGFSENMVAGRGFIALAAVTFGRWNPLGALAASLLFGAGDALQLRLQAAGFHVPYQLMLMLPYVLTMVALAGLVGKSTPPAATGKPYERASQA